MIRLTVVIPALNAAPSLPATLDAVLAARVPGEDGLCLDVLVVDGGSRDATIDHACDAGVAVIESPRGRGNQLAAGGAAAGGDWLLFLHADTRLPRGWENPVRAFAADAANAQKAAVFALRFDDASRAARRVERIAAWRSRLLGLPYGDQGLLIARDFYRALGGYAPLPIMEDVDLVRRIGRRRLVTLPCHAVTSARRYRRTGYTLRMAGNLLCLVLYFCGVSPRRIARLYG